MTILKIVVVSLVTALVTVFFLIPNLIQGDTVKVKDRTYQQTAYIHALAFCESSGRSDIKILDSNKKYSYGAFQFQMATFLSKGKKYGLIATSTSPTEGEEMIYDVELQEAIATKMLEDGGERNWLVCTRKLGNYPKSPTSQ